MAPAPPPGDLEVEVPGPQTLRVGLATDLLQVTLPCCDADVTATLGKLAVPVVSALHIEPLGIAASRGLVWRLQVAALKDDGQAQGLAVRLQKLVGEPADSRFDPGSDLFRVRLGRYPTREVAEAAQRRLQRYGVDSSWVVSEGGGVGQPGFRVTQAGKMTRVDGRWLAVGTVGEGGMRWQGRRYRGRLLVYLNDRGTLNVINELPVEDYLRGVVPGEMGPRIYNQLEALKAQAVAARTYAVRNAGEFAEEGYDICATPRCQVYEGMDAEDPLSDRAVAETAGQVMIYDGQPIDALYSSTCGGHTEDVEVMFPLKRAPYLRGVPCFEEGATKLGGAGGRGRSFPTALVDQILPIDAGVAPARAFGERLHALAGLAGLVPPEDRLASLERRELQRFLASTFDLAVDARLFVEPADLPYLVAMPPPGWGKAEVELAAYLLKSGLFDATLAGPVEPAEQEELLLRLAIYLGVVREEQVSFRSVAGGVLHVASKDAEKDVPIPAELLAFRGQGDAVQTADLELVPGDRLRLFFTGDDLRAVVQDINPQGAAFDRTSNRSSWTRFRSASELAALVRTRYPGFALQDFDILSRGRSGRVGKVRLRSADGQAIEIEGLAVRWTFDLLDNWFTAKRLAPPGKPPGWLFTGRGWGHGVGLCQVGAYGMAVRGRTYAGILHHYYTGVRLARVSSSSAAGSRK
ncbi:MAG: SpoIID/LytB domain-containing protein [Acidobacteriota bacterium]